MIQQLELALMDTVAVAVTDGNYAVAGFGDCMQDICVNPSADGSKGLADMLSLHFRLSMGSPLTCCHGESDGQCTCSKRKMAAAG
jgi:hypothetical protein